MHDDLPPTKGIEEALMRFDQGLSPEQVIAEFPHLAKEIAEIVEVGKRIANMANGPEAVPPTSAIQAPTLPGVGTSPLGMGEWFGHFEILESLGQGGMGVVYRARNTQPNRVVALKVIPASVLEGSKSQKEREDFLARFKREGEAMAKVSHTNVVTLFSVGKESGQLFIEMELVRGHNLGIDIELASIPGNRASKLLEAVARGVAAAHEQDIIHRDIKPGNILIDQQGQPKLTDFGLAKVPDSEQLTRNEQIVGTPSYAAPEQLIDPTGVDARADIYSLGATLYALVTGHVPFKGSNPLQTMALVKSGDLVPPRKHNPAIDRDLETICLKCMDRDPASRYQTAEALADDLRRYTNGESIAARRPWLIKRYSLWYRRNLLVATLSHLVAALVLTVLVGGWRQAVVEAGLRDKAEKKFELAFQAVDDSFTRLSEELLLEEPGMQLLRKNLLAQPRRYYEVFVAEKKDDHRILLYLAKAHIRLGQIIQLVDPNPEPDALAHYRQARAVLAQLRTSQPDNLEYRRLDAQANLKIAHIHYKTLRFQDATSSINDSLKDLELYHSRHPEDRDCRMDISSAYNQKFLLHADRGEFAEADEARQACDRYLAPLLQEGNPLPKPVLELAKTKINAANWYEKNRSRAKSLQSVEEAIALLESLTKQSPRATRIQQLLGTAYSNAGVLYRRNSEFDKAIEAFTRALTIRKRLVHDNPEVTQFRLELNITLSNLVRPQE